MTGQFASIIGDSSLDGWATFLVYLVTAGLSFLSAWRSTASTAGARRIATARSRRRFWLMLACLLLLLGLSRRLDLQALAAHAARSALHSDDIYREWTGLQIGLVGAIGAFGTIGLIIALLSFRRAEASVLGALAGAATLTIFTMIRTISPDQVLQQQLAPHLQVNNLIEVGALAIIAAASYAFARQLRDEGKVERLRNLKIQEQRRLLGEKRRAARS